MIQTKDVAVRGLARCGRVRLLACVTTHLVNELQRRHGTWPVATAALGRTASVAAMMAMQLKGQERLTVQVKGDGPLGAILVDADSDGHVRGYVQHPHVHLPANALGKLDVGGAVGHGMLYVLRDMGLREVYRGGVELQTGEIGDDFTYYFAVSEQTPSSVGAGVLVDTDNTVICSGGFIVQLLPGHTDEDIDWVEAQIRGLSSVTDLLRGGMDATGLAATVLPDVEILEERPLAFRCTCSRDRLRRILLGLGKEELQAMLAEEGEAEVVCHFCSEVYRFSGDE
ncbi:MAG: Hsp33 family molecular chaperone HslO, partial [Alicyclobacillus herbarius]|uniref:Hsp33 family molecular chaperone HslO n=1 Tax=Alicyclobacillus herbarius TaxID=122960 RepID=UPI0023567DF3